MDKLSPIVSEFETEEDAQAYDRWFRAKVAASLADPRPPIPHDEVMAEMRQIIAEQSNAEKSTAKKSGAEKSGAKKAGEAR